MILILFSSFSTRYLGWPRCSSSYRDQARTEDTVSQHVPFLCFSDYYPFFSSILIGDGFVEVRVEGSSSCLDFLEATTL